MVNISRNCHQRAILGPRYALALTGPRPMPQIGIHRSCHPAAEQLRAAAALALAVAWWACAVVVGGSGVTIGLLTPGTWLVSVSVLSGLLGTMAAIAVAGWRGTPLTVALAVRAAGSCAAGLTALVGLSRVLDADVVTVVGALVLTGLPLAGPALRRTRDPGEVSAPVTVRARFPDERELHETPSTWLQADARWLDLIATTRTAQPRGRDAAGVASPPGCPGPPSRSEQGGQERVTSAVSTCRWICCRSRARASAPARRPTCRAKPGWCATGCAEKSSR